MVYTNVDSLKEYFDKTDNNKMCVINSTHNIINKLKSSISI